MDSGKSIYHSMQRGLATVMTELYTIICGSPRLDCAHCCLDIEEAEQLYRQLFPREEMFASSAAPAGGFDDSDEEAIEALGTVLGAAGISTGGRAEHSDAVLRGAGEDEGAS
eukprot:scaffold175307_cov51-Prasinocladus_malaysianus.AAC.1